MRLCYDQGSIDEIAIYYGREFYNFITICQITEDETVELWPQYRLTDHLGNTVVLFEDKDEDGIIKTELVTNDPEVLEVRQRLWYYPFGMQMDGIVDEATDPNHAYRYNGKELDEVSKTYEYGFRYYDPTIGRFTGVDPIADRFAHLSVYNYAGDSPVGNIDLHGLQQFSAVDFENHLAIETAAMVGAVWEGVNNLGLSMASNIYPVKGQANAIRNAAKNSDLFIPPYYSAQQVVDNYELKYSISNGYFAESLGSYFTETLESFSEALNILSLYGGGGPVLAGKIPFGFKSIGQFRQFGTALQAGLAKIGYKNTSLWMQGSAATGKSFSTGRLFNEGSDFDIAMVGDDIFKQATNLGLIRTGRSGPVGLNSEEARALGINGLLQALSNRMNRSVNIMIFENAESVKLKEVNSIRIPTNKEGF